MEEIFQLCDEITILRDGQWIATQPLEGLDMDKIIAMMVGRSLNQRFPDKENKPGEVILEVRNLTSLRQPSIRDVSFDLHKGEILGLPVWWGQSVPISWKPCLVSVRKPRAPLRCTERKLTTTMPTKPLITVLRW
jgi:methyl-galactoside transport system ATP-binding protein